MLGASLALTAALLYAIYQTITQAVARTQTTLSIGAATAYLSLIPALLLWHFDPIQMPLLAVGIGAGMGLFSTFLPILFLVAAIERIGATGTSQLSVAGPLAAVVMGWAFFGETLLPMQWGGAAILIGSVFVLLLHRGR